VELELLAPPGHMCSHQFDGGARGALFFGTLSHHLDLVLSFIVLLLYRQIVPTGIFLLLDVELSNLCGLWNIDLYLFYIEFILE
jgi:hypothetical protein